MTVLPNVVDRFHRMLDDLARATRYEIDKARAILSGLVGEKKIVFTPDDGSAGPLLPARSSPATMPDSSPWCFKGI